MSDKPIITDHALIRYIERVGGLDLTPIRNELTAITADAVKVGAAGVKLTNGCTIKLTGNVVTTVYPNKHERKPRKGKVAQ